MTDLNPDKNDTILACRQSLMEAFWWMETKQGHSYWLAVLEELENLAGRKEKPLSRGCSKQNDLQDRADDFITVFKKGSHYQATSERLLAQFTSLTADYPELSTDVIKDAIEQLKVLSGKKVEPAPVEPPTQNKLWAVGFFSLFTNELDIEFVEAPTWQEAVPQHSKIGKGEEDTYCHFLAPDSQVIKTYMSEEKPLTELEAWKQAFFDQDAMFDVKEV